MFKHCTCAVLWLCHGWKESSQRLNLDIQSIVLIEDSEEKYAAAVTVWEKLKPSFIQLQRWCEGFWSVGRLKQQSALSACVPQPHLSPSPAVLVSIAVYSSIQACMLDESLETTATDSIFTLLLPSTVRCHSLMCSHWHEANLAFARARDFWITNCCCSESALKRDAV